MVGNIIGVKWYYEGVGRKSGCVEFDLVSSMERSTQSSTRAEGGLLSIFLGP